MKNFGYTIDEEFVHVMGHVHLNCSGYIRSVWYMYLKTEKCCLKTQTKWAHSFSKKKKNVMDTKNEMD